MSNPSRPSTTPNPPDPPNLAAQSYTISLATTPSDLAAIRSLLEAYLSIQVYSQHSVLHHELSTLPGRYAAPHGALLLARSTTAPHAAIGLIGLRPFPELSEDQPDREPGGDCQAKRLFVLPEWRGKRIGKALMEELIKEARRLGYGRVKISVEVELVGAIAMYRRWGFGELEKWARMDELVFLALEL